MATVSCPHCSQSLDLPDDVTGNTVRCPKCQQTFATPAGSAVASGEPPARSGNAEAGVTEKAPSAKASAEPDSADFPAPRARRDVAGKGSLVVPIVLVAGAAMLGLCVCGAPVVIFLGLFPVAMVHHPDVEVVAPHEDGWGEAVDQVGKAEAAQQLPGFVKGVADAKDAIAKDKLLLKEYPPLPAPGWHGEYIKLLKERCKCDYQVIGGANLRKDEQEEIRGWNETMRAELQRRFGATILADLNQEGEKRWRDRIKPKENK